MEAQKALILPNQTDDQFFSGYESYYPATLPPLLHQPTCEETLLVKELWYNLGGVRFQAGWLSLLPAYLGHDHGVDVAASCFNTALQGMAKQGSIASIQAACARDYVKASSILQKKLSNPLQEPADFTLLMSTIFICTDWILNPQGSAAVSAHMRGADAIVLASSPKVAPSTLLRCIFLSNWFGAFLIPVARGTPSRYESKRWLELDTTLSGDVYGMARLSRLYMTLFIRLPRLIALVRTLREGIRTTRIKRQAIQLGLLCVKLQDQEVESRLLHQVAVRKTIDPRTAVITSVSFYSHYDCFWRQICYWQTRIYTNNLCLKLLELDVISSDILHRDILIAENIRMAKNIIMSWEFSSTGSGLAMAALRIGLVALWSVTLYMKDFNQGLPIATLRQWVRQNYNALHQRLYLFSEADMDDAADLLAGGPLQGFLIDFTLCWTKSDEG